MAADNTNRLAAIRSCYQSISNESITSRQTRISFPVCALERRPSAVDRDIIKEKSVNESWTVYRRIQDD